VKTSDDGIEKEYDLPSLPALVFYEQISADLFRYLPCSEQDFCAYRCKMCGNILSPFCLSMYNFVVLLDEWLLMSCGIVNFYCIL